MCPRTPSSRGSPPELSGGSANADARSTRGTGAPTIGRRYRSPPEGSRESRCRKGSAAGPSGSRPERPRRGRGSSLQAREGRLEDRGDPVALGGLPRVFGAPLPPLRPPVRDPVFDPRHERVVRVLVDLPDPLV